MEQERYTAIRLDLGRDLIPDHMFGAVKRYIMQGIQPGSFLTAVICNDLREAFARADEENAAAMHGWIKFFYNYTPSGCWGSPDAYRSWIGSFRENAA